ncbi:MAG TPA: sporulation integral membrane protein YtvI [Lachnospiraceae bacterium]|nr:sporulation integral membrane protein YtvI [Lachnospiraceae bacterium]
MTPLVKYCKIALNIITMTLAVVFCLFILPKIIVYFMPFVIGGIIAMIANPLVRFLEKRIKIVRKAGSAFVIIMTIAVIFFVIYLVVSMLIEQIVGFAGNLPQVWQSVSDTVADITRSYDRYLSRMPVSIREWLVGIFANVNEDTTSIIQSMGVPMAEAAGNFAKNLPLVIIGIIMAVLSSYFFIAERDYVVKLVKSVASDSVLSRWDVVYGTMKDAVGGYFRAQFKIMGVVFAILLAGFAILNVEYAILLALLIALLDFLPFFGTGAVMWPWAIYQLIEGNYVMAIGLVVTWAVSQLVRQLIQPKLVGDSIGLEPIPTLILLYIGFRIGGAFGLIIAVPIGMIIINLYRAGMFSNFVKSVKILTREANAFRRIEDEDEKTDENEE